MPSPDFVIGQRDSAATLESQLLDADQNPVNINGASVALRVAPIGGTALVVNGTATIVNGTIGEVAYTMSTLQTADDGFYLGQWEVTYAGGQIQTFPEPGFMLIQVERQLGL